MRVCAGLCKFVCVCVRAFMCVCAFVCAYLHVCARVSVYAYMYLCVVILCVCVSCRVTEAARTHVVLATLSSENVIHSTQTKAATTRIPRTHL